MMSIAALNPSYVLHQETSRGCVASGLRVEQAPVDTRTTFPNLRRMG